MPMASKFFSSKLLGTSILPFILVASIQLIVRYANGCSVATCTSGQGKGSILRNISKQRIKTLVKASSLSCPCAPLSNRKDCSIKQLTQ